MLLMVQEENNFFFRTMTYTYKKLKDLLEGTEDNTRILRKEDNAIIPVHEANTDYQEYLEWVKKEIQLGNTPTRQFIN